MTVTGTIVVVPGVVEGTIVVTGTIVVVVIDGNTDGSTDGADVVDGRDVNS